MGPRRTTLAEWQQCKPCSSCTHPISHVSGSSSLICMNSRSKFFCVFSGMSSTTEVVPAIVRTDGLTTLGSVRRTGLRNMGKRTYVACSILPGATSAVIVFVSSLIAAGTALWVTLGPNALVGVAQGRSALTRQGWVALLREGSKS